MRFFRQTLLLVCLGLPCALWAQPVAQDDVFATAEDTQVTHNLVSNDNDPTFAVDPTTVDLDISTPLINDNTITTAEGSFSVNASGVLTFIPTADFFGTASLQYTVQNTDVTPATSNPANITITVTAVNDAPVLSALIHVNIPMNTSGPANPFQVSDVDNDAATITVTAQTSNAILLPLTGIDLVHIGGGDWTVAVTPATGERGSATITLKISDGLKTDEGAFTVTVDNTPPAITAIGNYTIDEDTPTPSIDFTVGDGETAPGLLTINKATTNAAVIPVGSIVITGTGTDRHAVITPLANEFSVTPITITLTVLDGDGGSAVQTFTVEVNSVNDLPTITLIGTQTINEDQSTAVIPFTINDVETPVGSLDVTATSSNQAIVGDGDIVLGGTAGSRTVKINPPANHSGTVTISLFVKDGDNVTTTSTFTLNITEINDAPKITALADFSMFRNTTSAPLPFTVSDVDNDAASLTISTVSSNLTLIPAAGINLVHVANGDYTIAVTPAVGQIGISNVTVTVSDGLLSAQTTFKVTVNAPPNTNPTITAIGNYTIDEDTSTPTIDFTVGDSETLPAALTINRASSNTAVIPTGNIILSGTGTDRHVVITPLPNKFSLTPVTITLTVSDGDGGSAFQTFTVQVNSVNDLPTITPIVAQTINEDQSTAVIPFSINDVETPVASLDVTATSSNQAIVGDADIVLGGSAGSRTVKINPPANHSGTVTISISVKDADNGTTTSTFTLNINEIPDAPTITALADISVLRNTSSPAIAFTVADVDTPAGSLTVSALSSNLTVLPAAGINLVHVANGDYTIALTPATGQLGTSNVTVTVSDGSLNAQTTFKLTVDAAPNTNPTITAFTNQIIDEDTSTPTLDFTVNDGETAPGSLTIAKTTSNAAVIPVGRIVLSGTGTDRHVVITPLANQFSAVPITITLTVSDGDGGSAFQTFTVQVNSVNDLPTITPIVAQTINEDQSTAVIPFTINDVETPVGSLDVTATSSNQAIVADGDIVLGGSAGSRTVKINPPANHSGTVTISLSVKDADNGTTTSTFTLNINEIPDAPTITTLADISVLRNTSSPAIPFTVADVDTPAGSLIVSALSSNLTVLPAAGINLVHVANGDYTIAVTPATGQLGTSNVTVTVSDGSLNAQTTFKLTVDAAPNTNPTITAITNQVIDEDTSTPTLDFTVNDGETAPGSLTIAKTTSNAAVIPVGRIVLSGTGTDRHVVITPLANQFSATPVTITLTVSDGDGGSAFQTFTVQVNSVNDLPTITPIVAQTINEDQSTAVIPFTINDVETPVASLVVTSTSSDQAIVGDGDIVIGGSAGSRTVKINPPANHSGTVTISLFVKDGDNGTTTSTFTLNIQSVNDAPTITALTDVTTLRNTSTAPAPFTVADIDNAAGLLTVTAVSDNLILLPAAGITLVHVANGDYTIAVTPAIGQIGSANVTVKVSDGSLIAQTAFKLTVNAPINTNPTISALSNQIIDEDTSTPTLDFTINDGETTPGSLTITKATSNAAVIPVGRIVLTGTGTDRHVVVTPIGNQFSAAPVTITLTVTDGDGGSAFQTFTVQVNSINDVPVVSTITTQTINEDQSTAAIPFTISDIETPAAALDVTATSSVQGVVADAGIMLGGSAGSRTVRITPLPNQSGDVEITIKVKDGDNAITESKFTVSVQPVNDGPTIGTIADLAIPQNTQTGPLSFTVGDIDNLASALTMTPILSSNLTLVDNTDVDFAIIGGGGSLRSVNVRPKLNQFGTARITLTVTDGDKQAQTNFLLTVNHVDAPPTITPIADVTINEDVASANIPFTVNDPETLPDNLTVNAVSDNTALISNANITLVKGTAGDWTVKVTPTANANGTANITITVTDADLETVTTSFKVTVTPVNDAPTMVAITDKSTNEDTPTAAFNITVGDIDTPLANLTVTGLAADQTLVPTANISITGTGATQTVIITPAPNLNGSTLVTMTVNDGGGGTASRSFTLTVNAVPDPPTITAISVQNINEDQATGAIDFTVDDPDGGTLTVTATSDDQTLVPNANIVLAGTGANRTVKVTPAANQFGTANITVKVTDPTALSATTSFAVHIASVNDLPTISTIANQNIDESTSTGALSFTVGDIETPPGSLIVSGISTNTTLIPNANLVFGGSGGARTITVTPVAGQNGASTITVSVNDGTAITQTTFTVNVASVDDPPTISAITTQTTNEDTPTGAIAFTINDPDTPIASLVLEGTSSNTTLIPNGNIVFSGTGTSRTVVITPAPNQNGTTVITITVSDGPAHFVPTTFTLNVTPVNDLPTITAIADQTTNEDTPTGDIAFTIGDIETPAASLTVGATSDNTTLIPLANIVLAGSGSSRTIKLTPAADANGTANITVTVNDGTANASRTFKITVTNVEDPPTISVIADQNVLEDNGTGPIAFTINDIDTPIGSLTIGKSSSNTTLIPLANIVLAGTGSNRTVVVTPAANQNGTSTISITVDDGTTTTTRDFLITVQPVDDPPTISAIANRTINEDTDTGVITFTVNDPETPAASLVVTATSSDQAVVPDANIVLGGTTGTRNIKVTPAPDQNGTVTITVKVSDGANNATRTFTVLITPINDVPVILAQQALTINEGQQLVLNLGQLTIVDPDNTPAQLTLYVTGGPNYSITGANTITPNPAFNGDLNVPVFVGDGTGFSAQYSMLIKVNSTNDPPVIAGQSPLVTNEDQSITLQPSNFTITDLDGDTNFTLILSPGANYTVAGTTVTPNPNYNGVIFVGVKANDGQASSVANFNAQITVNPVNDPPTVTGQATLITPEETPLTLLIGNFIVSDPEPTSYTLSVLPPVPGAHYTLTGNTITPDLDYFGTLTVPITVSDGFANSVVYNATVTVTDVNDAPVIVSQNSLSTVEDIPITLLLTNYTVTDVDDPGYPTSFSLTVLAGTNYTFAGTTVTPTLDYSGPLNVNVQVRDPRGANSATFVTNITVTNAADAPNITGQKVVTMDEDQSRIITLDDLVYTDKDTPPASIILSVAAGTNYVVSGATITPSPNFFGTLTVNVQLNDGQANSNVWPLQVTVNNVNDDPIFNAIGNLTILEDAPVQTVTITGISPGPLESEQLTFTYVSDNTSLIKNIVESPTYNHFAPNNTITFKPEANQSGTANITVSVIDQGGNIVMKAFTITVTPVNDAPTLVAIPPMAITEDAGEQIITLTGLSPGGGGTESDQNLTFIVSADNQLFETLTIEPATINGTTSTASLKLKPKANANGVSNITIKVVDSGPSAPPNVNSFTRTFAMTITPVNDLPLVSSTPGLQAQPGIPYQYQVTATDADGDEMTITAPGLPSWLTLTQVSNGVATITGMPPAGLSGDVAIALFITDPIGPTEPLSYTITVNSPPALSDVFVTTLEDNQYVFKTPDFQAGFTDPDGNQMVEISITALPRRGQLLKANNALVAIGDKFSVADIATLSYKPKEDDNKNDTLQWNGSDGYGIYALLPAFMTVKITPDNDAPKLTLGEDTLRYRLGSEEQVQLTAAFDGFDPDGDDIMNAEIVFKITDNFEYSALHDYLLFTKTAKITGEFNTSNGSLKLIGRATASEYVAAIRSIKYQYKDAKELELNLRAVNIIMSDGKKSSDPAFSRVIKLIYSFEDLSIPTAFTPNQDDVNETWKISSPTGDGTLQLYEKAQVKVYNKHGALLWHTEGFNESWNGIYDGSILPSDTYFYTIDLNFNKVRYKGTVTILR